MSNIDKSALDELLLLIGGDVDSRNELIRSFLDQAPALSGNLTNGLTDVELLGRTAHTLKSSSRDFGAMTLSALCMTLEQQVRNDTLENAEDQVKHIQEELEKSVLELHQILGKCDGVIKF